MSNITFLPNSLILLVHLHLLGYHYASKPEYDDNPFSSARGLRERTKTMEDISYFLVGRLERMKDGPKAIFPTYPCIKPSDTVAFRTSLAKYLEQLRHRSFYALTLGTGPKPKDPPTPSNADSPVWWKHVVVRKSLLEECLGERFERLILALSTHTLMKVSKSPPIPHFFQELIRQPQLYHSDLFRLRSHRRQWEEKALYLEQRAEKLEQLRTQLSDAGHSGSKFQTTSTKEIQELAESKLNHIQSALWDGEDGGKALQLLLTLAGLSSLKPLPHSLSTLGSQECLWILQPSPVTPLPVSAAHHPSQLKKFRRPIFRCTTSPTEGKIERTTLKSTKHHVQPYLQAEATVHAALASTIARLRLKNEILSNTLKGHFSCAVVSYPPSPARLVHSADNLLGRLTDSVMEELGTPDLVAMLEERIEAIRTDILPAYHNTQDLLPERLPALEPRAKPPTGIPQRLPPQSSTSTRKASHTGSLNKPSPRKSIRFSMARQARPRVSTFRVFSGGEEVTQLINSTNDLPSDNENSDTEFDSFGTPGSKSIKTPKSKPKINRIWTASTPGARPPSTLKNSGMASRESFPNFMEAAVSLPSLLSAEGFLGVDDDGDDCEDDDGDIWYGADGEGIRDQLATPRANTFNMDHSDEDTSNDVHEPEEEGYEEEDSMSLKEILLSSRTSFVDLMGTQAVNLVDDDHVEDDSFKWDRVVS